MSLVSKTGNGKRTIIPIEEQAKIFEIYASCYNYQEVARQTGYSAKVITDFLKSDKAQEGLHQIEKAKTSFVDRIIDGFDSRQERFFKVIDRVLTGGETLDTNTTRDLKELSLSISHLLGNIAQLEGQRNKVSEIDIRKREVGLKEMEYGKREELYNKVGNFEGIELTIKRSTGKEEQEETLED